jgi:hypothetical protein
VSFSFFITFAVMDETTCIDIVSRFQDPSEAARALVEKSRQRWIEQGDYMDDMTAIVIFLDDPTTPSEECDETKTPNNASEGTIVDLEIGQGTSSGIATTVDETKSTTEHVKLGRKAQFWTLLVGATSGYLGGLCGIRGPPIILYFLHAPAHLNILHLKNPKTRRATAACITGTNVAMRVAYYLVETLALDGDDYWQASDWSLYMCVVVSSVLGVLVGSKMFEYLADSKTAIRDILAIFLLLCGASLLLSSFGGV